MAEDARRPATVDEIDLLMTACFGRDISPEERAAKLAEGQTFAKLRQSNLRSHEFQDKTRQIGQQMHWFKAFESQPPRLLAFGVHAIDVARKLAATGDLPLAAYLAPPRRPEDWAHLLEGAAPDCQVILLEPPGAPSLAALAARTAGVKPIRIQAVAFHGLHPDAIHVPPQEPAFPGFMGWHSALVLQSFLQGVAPDVCRDQFTASTYEAAGYFGAFEKEAARLEAADVGCDVAIAGAFLRAARERPLLLNPLDGADALHDLYAAAVADTLHLRLRPAAFLPGTTVLHLVWPVYPQIQQHLALQYATPMLFMMESEGYDLEEMIRRAYCIYTSIGHEEIAAKFGRELEARGLTTGRRW